ncbi:MAG: DUF4373 domain-containing protein [Bacteroidales bacterium]|nr:DUF4373 domain-containing protein [Bacteroidales bacterium]
MARPVKMGIDYFPLNIDIFDDEKVIPVSSEFGAKGECVVVRVLCAIYRNGYFAECSDAFIYKIAKQSNLPHTLVNEIIARLVKWGFFNKSVFDSFGVLTSAGIQKRWKEATRKRVPTENLSFWVLEDDRIIKDGNRGFLPEETPLTPTETTQKKRNKIKEKDNTDVLSKKKDLPQDFIPIIPEEKTHPPVPPAPLPDIEFQKFQKWILEKAPRVAKMEEPFTQEEYLRIKKEFSSDMTAEVLLSMHNSKDLLKKNLSANLTFRNWIQRRLKDGTKNRQTSGRVGQSLPAADEYEKNKLLAKIGG